MNIPIILKNKLKKKGVPQWQAPYVKAELINQLIPIILWFVRAFLGNAQVFGLFVC